MRATGWGRTGRVARERGTGEGLHVLAASKSSDGTPDDFEAALVEAGKAEARRRTTCQVFSADPVSVRGYTRLSEALIPVKN